MDERSGALEGALWILGALALALGVIHLWPDESPMPETRGFQSLLDPPSTPKSWFHGANGFLAEGDIFASGERFAAELWCDRIFNGKGIWILRKADATQVFGTYTFWAHDLDAQIALVNLKQQMLASGSDAGSWRQQLAASAIRNPYRNEEGAHWDESTLKVAFPGERP